MDNTELIMMECINCGSQTEVYREIPQKAISMQCDRCPDCTKLLGHYTVGSWDEWFIDKNGNKFN